MNIVKFAEFVSYLSDTVGNSIDEDSIESIHSFCKELIGLEIKEMEARVTALEAKPNYVSAANVDDLLKAMYDGRKIEAIRQYRNMTGARLTESKDAVEKYYNPKTLLTMAICGNRMDGVELETKE